MAERVAAASSVVGPVAAPSVVRPVTGHPPMTEPVTGPARMAEPATTLPSKTEPVTTPAPIAEPVTTLPPKTEPATTPPSKTEPVTTPACMAEPVTTLLPMTEPVTAPSSMTEPATTHPPKPQPATPPPSPGGPVGLGWDALRDEPGPDTTRCLGLYAKLAGGVAVVTALDAHGGPTGMTVSALTSLSARPPLLLACLRGGSRTLAALRWRGAFAVSLLAEHQRAVAERFADPALPPAARCTGVPLRQVLGLPVLDEAVGWTVCLVEDVRRYGDHHTVVGRLRAVGLGGGRPLVWHNRSFHTLDHDSVHTLDHD